MDMDRIIQESGYPWSFVFKVADDLYTIDEQTLKPESEEYK